MSYTRSYRETVSQTVHYHYPASQSGGSGSETVTIPIDINIFVDTVPFDNSVQHCDSSINLLTGAVVATEEAEVISKNDNSIKVADTIIGGFFSLIRNEIGTQIAELYQNVEALLMHLKELAQSCRAKKTQMEGDYNRIASRYSKIFEDLNHELSNRVHELDKPTFIFKKETDSQKQRITENELVNTISVFGTESGYLQSKVSSSITKKRALDTISACKRFLWQQKIMNNTIQRCMLNEVNSGLIFVPVCYFEFNINKNQVEKNIFCAEYLSPLIHKEKQNELMGKFSSNTVSWRKFSQEEQKDINIYFNSELNSKSSENEKHSIRVREMIQKIVNLNSIKSI